MSDEAVRQAGHCSAFRRIVWLGFYLFGFVLGVLAWVRVGNDMSLCVVVAAY